MIFRPLPWEYGVRNLFRRPGRSLLTLMSLTLVVLLVLLVVGFLRGLEATLADSGDPRVVLIHARGAGESLESSSVTAGKCAEVSADLREIQRRRGPGGTEIGWASPEIFLGAEVALKDHAAMGLVRGVTVIAPLVRRSVQIVHGSWPGSQELLVGRLAAAKLGLKESDLALGATLRFEGRTWTVRGQFASAGSALEAEIWCPLEDLKSAMKRTDVTLLACTLANESDLDSVQLYFQERIKLELEATQETAYYQALQRHYGPVRSLAWLVVALVACAGVFTGLNTMYGSVVGRVRELATLQTLGFLRRAIALSLVQEALLLAAAGSLCAALLALVFVNGAAVRFTMGAFTLRIDSVALGIGCGVGLLLGLLGALPPALKALRQPIVEGLKSL